MIQELKDLADKIRERQKIIQESDNSELIKKGIIGELDIVHYQIQTILSKIVELDVSEPLDEVILTTYRVDIPEGIILDPERRKSKRKQGHFNRRNRK